MGPPPLSGTPRPPQLAALGRRRLHQPFPRVPPPADPAARAPTRLRGGAGPLRRGGRTPDDPPRAARSPPPSLVGDARGPRGGDRVRGLPGRYVPATRPARPAEPRPAGGPHAGHVRGDAARVHLRPGAAGGGVRLAPRSGRPCPP